MNARTAKYKVMHCKSLNSENLSSYYFQDLSEAQKEISKADRMLLGTYLYEKIGNKWMYVAD